MSMRPGLIDRLSGGCFQHHDLMQSLTADAHDAGNQVGAFAGIPVRDRSLWRGLDMNDRTSPPELLHRRGADKRTDNTGPRFEAQHPLAGNADTVQSRYFTQSADALLEMLSERES